MQPTPTRMPCRAQAIICSSRPFATRRRFAMDMARCIARRAAAMLFFATSPKTLEVESELPRRSLQLRRLLRRAVSILLWTPFGLTKTSGGLKLG